MEYTELSNGVKVPLLGLGTFMVAPGASPRPYTVALKNGYWLIDWPNAYLNEKAVGEGSKSLCGRYLPPGGRVSFHQIVACVQ